MTFPNISYKATNTELEEKWQDMLETKFDGLNKYLGEETDVKCEVEFEKAAPQQSGEVFRVEANLWVAGKLYRAEATEGSFEMAIDEVQAELDKEMRRANDRQHTLMKRGGRAIKKMMQMGG